MERSTSATARKQLARTLDVYRPLLRLTPPLKGWIRAIRTTLGMSVRHYAQRLGVAPSRVAKLEQGEITGALTLKNLKRAAEALDCVLVYAIVPRHDLEEIIRRQAQAVVADRYRRVTHTMALEEQSVSDQITKEEIEAAIEDLVRRAPKELWRKKL